MNKKIVYKHSKGTDDYVYDEESAVFELNSEEFSKLKDNLGAPNKSYILKNSTGIEYKTHDINDVARLLSEKNITEVVVEEVSVDNAKLSRFKMNNSHFEKKLKLTESNTNLKEIKERNFSLLCEEILNEDDVSQTLKIIESSPTVFTDDTSDTNSVFTSSKKLVKRTSKIYKNFFRIKNNSEVFKLGKYFLDDFTQGKRCFGFSSNGELKVLINTLYGIGSFFNFYCHTRALLFCSDEELLQMQKLVHFEQKSVYDSLLDDEYTLWDSEGISIITYSTFRDTSLDKAYDFIDKLTKLSGVVFCSTPDNETLIKDIELYFQVFQRVDNFSCIVEKESTKLKEIHQMISYLKNYKVNIKGVIVGEK